MITRASLLALLAVSPLMMDLAAAQPAVEVELRDGFEGGDFAPEGGLYYRENFEQSAGTVTFQSETVHQGTGALRLSVKSLCPTEADGCSERAEVWEKTELRVPYDTGVWYGFAMRFDDPIPQEDHRYVMAQWKREIGPGADGDFSPFLALRMREGAMFATIETNYHPPTDAAPMAENGVCPDGLVPVWLRPETRQMRILVATDSQWTPHVTEEFTHCTDQLAMSGPGILPQATTNWHDYAFYTKPGPEGDGHVVIAVDGQVVREMTGRIGHADEGLGEKQYFKFGPYRDASAEEWSLVFDDFARSPDCGALLEPGVCAALP